MNFITATEDGMHILYCYHGCNKKVANILESAVAISGEVSQRSPEDDATEKKAMFVSTLLDYIHCRYFDSTSKEQDWKIFEDDIRECMPDFPFDLRKSEWMPFVRIVGLSAGPLPLGKYYSFDSFI